jgi:general secretion pathway protein I
VRIKSQQGLTLLEVMVALLVFALTGSAMLNVINNHVITTGDLEEITFATWVANNRHHQLQYQLKIGEKWPPVNNQKGSEKMGERTWYWQQRVIATTDENLRSVEIRVGLDSEYQSSITSVTSYLAKPSQTKN